MRKVLNIFNNIIKKAFPFYSDFSYKEFKSNYVFYNELIIPDKYILSECSFLIPIFLFVIYVCVYPKKHFINLYFVSIVVSDYFYFSTFFVFIFFLISSNRFLKNFKYIQDFLKKELQCEMLNVSKKASIFVVLLQESSFLILWFSFTILFLFNSVDAFCYIFFGYAPFYERLMLLLGIYSDYQYLHHIEFLKGYFELKKEFGFTFIDSDKVSDAYVKGAIQPEHKETVQYFYEKIKYISKKN